MQDNSHDAQQDSNVAQNSHYSAADLKIGEEGIVSALNCDESMKHRLASMGIFAGASIKAPVTSAFGNPRSYMVRGYQLCMRTNEAMTILLKTNIPALSE